MSLRKSQEKLRNATHKSGSDSIEDLVEVAKVDHQTQLSERIFEQTMGHPAPHERVVPQERTLEDNSSFLQVRQRNDHPQQQKLQRKDCDSSCL